MVRRWPDLSVRNQSERRRSTFADGKVEKMHPTMASCRVLMLSVALALVLVPAPAYSLETVIEYTKCVVEKQKSSAENYTIECTNDRRIATGLADDDDGGNFTIFDIDDLYCCKYGVDIGSATLVSLPVSTGQLSNTTVAKCPNSSVITGFPSTTSNTVPFNTMKCVKLTIPSTAMPAIDYNDCEYKKTGSGDPASYCNATYAIVSLNYAHNIYFSTLKLTGSGVSGMTCCRIIVQPICNSNPCPDHSTCSEDQHNYTCTCVSGYQVVTKIMPKRTISTCQDIDECLTFEASPCNANTEVCVNTPGSYRCVCSTGYVNTTGTCRKAQGCDHSSPCHQHADCVDTQGSYTCTCIDPYLKGDGFTNCTVPTCQSLPAPRNSLVPPEGENSLIIYPKSQNFTCANGYKLTGSESLQCNASGEIVGTPPNCTNIDECSDGTHSCNTNALCQDTDGS
eukprot:scpid77653/ scgid28446/ EGF-like module-containing mucin-like hormone receptor-like 2; EGF-like module receptor 2